MDLLCDDRFSFFEKLLKGEAARLHQFLKQRFSGEVEHVAHGRAKRFAGNRSCVRTTAPHLRLLFHHHDGESVLGGVDRCPFPCGAAADDDEI
jgi:hypothetical protein